MRIYSKGSIDEFIHELNDDPAVEVLPTIGNNYLYFKYRREETEGPHNGTENFTGAFEYGYIYVNSKGRYTLTGVAVDDWKEWEGLRR